MIHFLFFLNFPSEKGPRFQLEELKIIQFATRINMFRKVMPKFHMKVIIGRFPTATVPTEHL